MSSMLLQSQIVCIVERVDELICLISIFASREALPTSSYVTLFKGLFRLILNSKLLQVILICCILTKVVALR